jgi:hypothetical protein
LAAKKHARFMLRMRLSLDCGSAAFATQGGSDHLFKVEIALRAKEAVDPTDHVRGGVENDALAETRWAAPDAECIEIIFGSRSRLSH